MTAVELEFQRSVLKYNTFVVLAVFGTMSVAFWTTESFHSLWCLLGLTAGCSAKTRKDNREEREG